MDSPSTRSYRHGSVNEGWYPPQLVVNEHTPCTIHSQKSSPNECDQERCQCLDLHMGKYITNAKSRSDQGQSFLGSSKLRRLQRPNHQVCEILCLQAIGPPNHRIRARNQRGDLQGFRSSVSICIYLDVNLNQSKTCEF